MSLYRRICWRLCKVCWSLHLNRLGDRLEDAVWCEK